MINGRIYCVFNKVNGKRYIGKTCGSVKKRWLNHQRMPIVIAQRSYLQRAIAKYGAAAFLVNVIRICRSAEELNNSEIALIKTFGTRVPDGYNLRAGGDGGALHESSRAKIRDSKKRFWGDPENKQRMITLFNEPARVAKRSAAGRLRKHTDEEKAKLSASLKRFYQDPVEMEKRREIARNAARSEGGRRAASERMKRIWSDPVTAEAMKSKMRGRIKTPMGSAARERRSVIAKRLWAEGKLLPKSRATR